jgi:trehalose-6-phosphate synthase
MNTYNVPAAIKTLEDADTLLFVWTRLEKEFADRVEEAKELIRANNGSTHFKLKGGGNRTNIDWQAAAESVGMTEEKAQPWAKTSTVKPSVTLRTVADTPVHKTQTTVEVKVL